MALCDLECFECRGSGLNHRELCRCEACRGVGRFDSEYELLVGIIVRARVLHQPVIQRICEHLFSRVQRALDGASSLHHPRADLHRKLCQSLHVPEHNQLLMPWNAWELYALYVDIPAELAHLGALVMQASQKPIWSSWRAEVGLEAAETMIRCADDDYSATLERWNYLLSEVWKTKASSDPASG